jgi:hypothetical protein
MLANEQEPKKQKKKKGLLYEKMGLDQGSETYEPPATKPGIFPGSVEGELNARAQEEEVGTKVQEKLSRRPNGR